MRFSLALLAAGAVLVSAGLAWIFPPLGPITLGACMGAWGLMRETGAKR